MKRLWAFARNDPGGAFVIAALLGTLALYAATFSRGLVNYDDTWLVRDNFLLHELSAETLYTILFDTSPETRFILGAEYLPIRDLSIAIDFAIWGDWYGGFHLTNVVLYGLGIVVWFAVLLELGLDRKLSGLAILLWALHPAHAESVAWISERKGLLALVFAGVAVLGYLRFRRGASRWWLGVATLASMLTVWSKAPFAFALAALGPLELVAQTPRVSWRRSLVGLGTIALVGITAFVPVVLTAMNLRVVDSVDRAPAGWLAMALGTHGFYLQLAVAAVPNAITYPIRTLGPSVVDIVIGTVGLLLATAAAVVPRRVLRVPAAVRIGAIVWLFGWLPVSRLVLPLKAVLVADRYILFSTLGAALVAAAGLLAIRASRARSALIVAIVVALAMRTLDSQANWRDTPTLWHRAVTSNPGDGDAWAAYVEALEEVEQHALAYDALREGLQQSRAPRLLLRKALLMVERGQRSDALESMRAAAEAGEVRAMVNLAIMLAQDGNHEEALRWARRSVETAPLYGKGYKTLGGILLAMKRPREALAAFEKAHKIWPIDLQTRHDMALALIALGRTAEARTHLERCLLDPVIGPQARRLLATLPR